MPTSTTPSTLASRLRRPQIGQETTWGTQVVATAALMGTHAYPSFKPKQKSTNYDEDRGSLANAFNSNILEQGGTFSIALEYASYEDILYALYNVVQNVTPSGGGPYTYTFAGPLTSVNGLLSLTIEDGYDVAGKAYVGCIGQKMTIKGNAAKQMQVDWSGEYKSYVSNQPVNIVSSTNASPIVITTATDPFATGQQVVVKNHATNTNANGTWTITRTGSGTYSLTGSTGNGVGGATGTITRTITPAVADRTVVPIIFPTLTFYADPTGNSIGTTQISNALYDYSMDIENGWALLYTGDSLNPTQLAADKMKVMFKPKLLYTDAVKTLCNSLETGTRNLFKILHSSSPRSLELDFCGILSADINYYPDREHAIAVELEMESQYDGGFGNQMKAIVVNQLSALP